MEKIGSYWTAQTCAASDGFYETYETYDGPVSRLIKISAGLLEILGRRRNITRTIEAYEKLDDAMLRDIGFSRGEINWRADSIAN